ncbi:Ig-like domain-containing protein [Corallococcus sp. CA054B]|uniref:Ig-like domain-containing protein n=1 Tax=Corallococcus sp. CA054B TaxID=2316734 RepID=UPI002695C0AD
MFLSLQELPALAPYDNEAPVIDSLTASSNALQPGASLALSATVHDPNPGDTLTLAWTTSGGTFSNTTSAASSWTAPAFPGVQTLTLTVTDSQGSAVSVSLSVNVVPDLVTGDATLDISFNRWPVVTRVSASLNRLDAGQSTAVTALASDADADALSYQWTASCPGTWADATSSTASFIPSSRPAGACNNCRLTVAVQDGRGGQTTGSLNLCVADTAPVRFAPTFTSFYQSATSTSPEQTVAFDVTALDPQASPLTFAWTASTGALATAQDTANTSHVVWTAPAFTAAGILPTITVVVTNAHGLSASKSFTVSGLPAAIDPTSALTSGGLTWVRPGAATVTWMDGMTYCSNTAIAGQTGWRMPTVEELTDLWVDKGTNQLAAAGWPLDWIWAMTPISNGHRVTNMATGGSSYSLDSDKQFLTCVRGTGEYPATVSHAGRTWMRPDASLRTYANAETYCSSRTTANHTGWRLPTSSELEALHVEKGGRFLANAGWTLEWIWSSTPYASGLIVVRGGGTWSLGDRSASTFNVTCVYP